MWPVDKLLVTVDEACRMLSVSRSYFYAKLVSTGRIKKLSWGRKTVFAVETLQEFVRKELEKTNG